VNFDPKVSRPSAHDPCVQDGRLKPLARSCPRRYRFGVARLPFTDPGRNLNVNIFRVLAHAPEAARGFSSCGSRLLGETKLEPKLRELAIDAISVKLNSPYEWSHHAKWALDVGATAVELEALKSGDYSNLGPLERTVVEYALKVEDNTVTQADIDGLVAAELPEMSGIAKSCGLPSSYSTSMALRNRAVIP
jgi:hypothetical protein